MEHDEIQEIVARLEIFYKTLDELEGQSPLEHMCDVTTTLNLPFGAPTELATVRLHLEHSHLAYRPRQDLATLVNHYQNIPQNLNILHIFGNVGGGKSYRLAALSVYLRYLRRQDSSSRRVVYVSSSERLCNDLHRWMRRVLLLAFADDSALMLEIGACESWDQLIAFVQLQKSKSIVFIIDQWNKIEERQDIKEKLVNLVDQQMLIRAISAGAPGATAMPSTVQSRGGADTAVDVTLFGGLSDVEWKEWLTAGEFSGWTPEHIDRFEELTGRIPLYIWECISSIGSSAAEKMNKFEQEMGSKAYGHLFVYSQRNVQNDDMSTYFKMMSAAVGGTPCEVVPGLYDQRYFYKSDNFLVAVSHLARRIMTEILFDKSRELYFEQLSPSWIQDAMKSDNPVTRGFAFEQYAIASIFRNPDKFTDGKVTRIDEIAFFFGDAPSSLNASQSTLYIPKRFNLQHVDVVIRHRTAHALFRYDFQITCQSIASHRSTLDFYKEDGAYLQWLREEEVAWIGKPKKLCQTLCWVVPPQKSKLPQVQDQKKPVPFSQTISVLRIE